MKSRKPVRPDDAVANRRSHEPAPLCSHKYCPHLLSYIAGLQEIWCTYRQIGIRSACSILARWIRPESLGHEHGAAIQHKNSKGGIVVPTVGIYAHELPGAVLIRSALVPQRSLENTRISLRKARLQTAKQIRHRVIFRGDRKSLFNIGTVYRQLLANLI